MIRSKVRDFFASEAMRPMLKRSGRILIVIGFLWILSFPFLARKVFTSENAFKGDLMGSKFDEDESLFTRYKSYQTRLEPMQESKDYNQFIMEELSQKVEMYRQPLFNGLSDNIYLYLRSANGPGNECSIVTFPSNYKPSVAMGLTLVQAYLKHQPDWQSKDFIVLFYQDTEYAFAVREFLDAYYLSQDHSDPNTYFTKPIEGRCGYLRQAFPFVAQEYDYNKVSMFLDGVNSQLSDIDFYSETKERLAASNLKFDFSLPQYFRLNPYLEQGMNFFIPQSLQDYYLEGLKSFLANFDIPVNTKGRVLPMLESLKNAFIGKVHYPHTYFIQQGVHSMTYRLYKDAGPEKKESLQAEKAKVLATLKFMEQVMRLSDQLDEQLHAGYYFYILTSRNNFVSNSGFVYPLVLILLGYFSPIIYGQADFNKDHWHEHEIIKQVWGVSIIFNVLNFSLGAFYFILPNLIYQGLTADSSAYSMCFASSELKTTVTIWTLIAIPVLSLLYLVAFRVWQRSNVQGVALEYLWFFIKNNNWYANFTLVGAMVVYEFPAALIAAVFVYPYIHNAVYIGSSKQDLAVSIISIALIGTLSFLFLFGTLLASEESQGFLQTFVYLIQQAILDHYCAGSNVWIFLCGLVFTNLTAIVKIWTN